MSYKENVVLVLSSFAQLLLVLSAYILLLARALAGRHFSYLPPLYARCPLDFIYFRCAAVLFALPFTSQSIWAHLLYVDHCLDSARTRARGRTSERRRRGSQHHAKRCNHFSGMAYCVLHWRRSRTEYGRRHLVFAESASWRLLFLISLSGKIIKAREKLIIIDVFTPFLPQCNPIPVVTI